MKNIGKIILFLGIILPGGSRIFALSSTELIENSREYDQKEIEYRGEVVGEVMRRGNFAWVNLNDGINAIGIWVPADLAKEIKFTGNYHYRGDRVEVIGVLNRACAEHGGDLDIHALGMAIYKSGHEIYRPLHRSRFNLALVFLGISFILIGLNAFLKRKRNIVTE